MTHKRMTNIEVVNKSIESYNERIEFQLPGTGEAYESCGKPFHIGHPLPPVLHGIRAKHTCHRFECPVCWTSWQKREARNASYRLNAYNEIYKRKTVHYVLSPPQSVEYHTYGSYRALKKRSRKVAKQRGIKGGVMIFHERACRYSDPDNYTDDHEGSYGPHFHVLGDGWLSVRVKEFFLQDGWVVKNLRIRTRKGIYGTLVYILDHAVRGVSEGIPDGYPALRQSSDRKLSVETWFGTMSYNRLKIPKFKGSAVIYCPICKEEISKEEWFVLEWIGRKDPPNEDHGVYEEGKNGFIVTRSVTSWY